MDRKKEGPEKSRFSKTKEIAREFGAFAEDLASRDYVARGYAILERNWFFGKTEIDIIAQKDDVVVIIEVKARSGNDMDALEAVTRDKRRRMIRAADAYLQKLPGNVEYRFDIVTVTGNISNHSMEVFEDAFVASDLF